jgi:cytochrome c2
MRWRLPVTLAAAVAATSFFARKRRREEPQTRIQMFSAMLAAGIAAVAVLASAAVWYLGHAPSEETAKRVAILQRYGCAGCHSIPGVPNADGRVGPPLAGLNEGLFVGGAVRNEPQALADWIVDPPRWTPGTAMPRTGISLGEAQEVVRYLEAP